MSSYVVREKEREWDTESVRSGRQASHYTTVKRYKVPDRSEETRSNRTVIDYQDDDRGDEEVRIVRRERSDTDRDRDIVSYRVVEREREREPEPQREERSERRIKIIRQESRSPSPEPERVREYRYERDNRYDDRLSSHSRPYDLERYSKSTEYFSRPEPQPIIIRERAPQPIIIQEAPREQQVIVRQREASPSPPPSPPPQDHLSLVQRTEIDERSAVIPAPQQPPPQEDYYYERVTREIDRPRRRVRNEDRGRERREHDSHSEDDILYVRRETEDYSVRDESPHTKRHLAEGAIAGLGAAALMRHHKKRQGEEPGHRGRQALGYAVAGAVGAEGLSRARRRWEDRSRSRSVEEIFEDRDGRRERHHRRRKSSSHKNRNTALAVAGIAAAAAAAYAASKKKNGNTTIINEGDARRSRSRRRHSVSGASDRSGSRSLSPDGKATDPKHRNRRIAQAGLAGAALAGIADHQRNKSRGRSRSKSRIREGVPIVAAGLGSAAVAGLYETFKARKEKARSASRAAEKEKERARSVSRSRSRSRSRDRSGSVGYAGPRAAADAAMIEYGADPLYTRDHDRRRSRSRGRSRSSSGSDRRHRHHSGSRSRSRSRGAQLATAAAAAGVTGLAVNEARKRRERKKEEKERRRKLQELLLVYGR